MHNLAQTTAVILAGGAGTRLRSVVADRPKVLAPLGGRPFITYLLDRLAQQGLKTVVLCTGYMGEQVRETLGDEYRGMSLRYSQETEPLGTGGALVQALPLISSPTILIMNGDSYCDTDLRASYEWHHDRESRATLVLAHVNDGGRYGRVELGANGRICGFREKNPAYTGGGWINSGIYWFQRDVLAALPAGRAFSLERDILGAWPGAGLNGFRDYGRFLDIGVPEDFARAERFLAEVHYSSSRMSA
jgi:D-glycero-alpha-D-manno-heptose 1-phosphate guanylyltransferase